MTQPDGPHDTDHPSSGTQSTGTATQGDRPDQPPATPSTDDDAQAGTAGPSPQVDPPGQAGSPTPSEPAAAERAQTDRPARDWSRPQPTGPDAGASPTQDGSGPGESPAAPPTHSAVPPAQSAAPPAERPVGTGVEAAPTRPTPPSTAPAGGPPAPSPLTAAPGAAPSSTAPAGGASPTGAPERTEGPTAAPGGPAPAGPRTGPTAGPGLSGVPPRSSPLPPPRQLAGIPPRVTPGAGRPAAGAPQARLPQAAAPVGAQRGRRAKLTLRRIDPWSVFLYSAVASVFVGIALIVAVLALYALLSGLGVTESVNSLIGDVTSAEGETSTDASFFSLGAVFGFSIVLAAVNVVVLTGLATLGAFLHNLVAQLTGGIELTLGDRD